MQAGGEAAKSKGHLSEVSHSVEYILNTLGPEFKAGVFEAYLYACMHFAHGRISSMIENFVLSSCVWRCMFFRYSAA